MAVSKVRAQRREGDFSAEIPCYRELTGNFALFGSVSGAWQGLRTAESGGFHAKFPCPGTGNLQSDNREFKIAEQGIRNRTTGNLEWITGNTFCAFFG
jgi:hypothetical protein